MLSGYLRRRVVVVTDDGSQYLGVLHAADQLCNLVLDSAVQRLPREPAGGAGTDNNSNNNTNNKKKNDDGDADNGGAGLGLPPASRGAVDERVGVLMLRGSSVVSVGLVDVMREAAMDLESVPAREVPPVQRTPKSVASPAVV